MAAASASSAGGSSAARKHAFDAGDTELHTFLQTLPTHAEKETAMVARRWGSFPATIGLSGEGFELLRNDPRTPIQFRLLWAASDPDLQATFKESCPKGIWVTVSLPRSYPYEAPTFSATCDELRGPIPPAALCKAVAKVCNDRSLKICESAVAPDGSIKPKTWPVKSALGMLDKGIGTILSVLGSRLGGKSGSRAPAASPVPAATAAAGSGPAPPSTAAPGLAAAAAGQASSASAAGGTAAAPGAVERLMEQGAALDRVQAMIDAALAAGDKLRLSGLSSECGVVMTALDGIDCGPRGSPARELRREMIRRAERMGDAAERAAAAL